MKIGLGTPIWVPYEEREAAMALGAQWRSGMRRYLVPQSLALEPFARWNRPAIIALPSEDRSCGGSDLFVDPVPSSCWFSNVRSCVDAVDWVRLRHFVGTRCHWTCEICGAEVAELDVHERWIYDDATRVQSLARLIGLCDPCHRVTHFGKAELDGKRSMAFAHLCRVNSWTQEEGESHVARAFELFEERSHYDWELDLNVICSVGIELVEPTVR